ncbi:MAG TPA: hypothetical protein VK212_04705 [Lentimicrobium sp.]|nr:hypothetical protein [Lentimicrobium sp.]
MKGNPLNRVISVNPDGRLCIDNQEVDSDMILFEEEAKNLLEEELLEGPLSNYPEYGTDEELLFEEDDNDSEAFGDFSDDEDITFGDSGYDINNDDYQFN